ncbi:peptidase S41 family protein [Xylariomycetidae sp. FL2044]|nr:peptidase S41 family protein [Xylariomycetidae sp. FL2044]
MQQGIGSGIVDLSLPKSLARLTVWCCCLFVILLAKDASAVPAHQYHRRQNQTTPTTGANPSACAEVASASAAFASASPEAAVTIPATLAFECLQTVPNKPEQAAQLITSIKAYAQWQSTLAYLKAPPASYTLPAVDVQGQLDNISTTATAGGFASEYEFQLAIYETFLAAHDGHFSYIPDSFMPFAFRSKILSDIVSVSSDGKAVPKLYHLSSLASNATTEPVAIAQINGQDAAAMILESSLKFSAFQDPDSQWNSQFPQYASPSSTLGLAASFAFNGASMTVTYENGKEETEDTIATIRSGVDLTGIGTGEDFYEAFCNPDSQAAAARRVKREVAEPPPKRAIGPEIAEQRIAGYPAPVARDNGGNTTAGYFLKGDGYDDVAVLAVSSFSPAIDIDANEYFTDFQNTVDSFLSQSRDSGKKRLVVDLTSNGGGFVLAGFELFAQLFPDADQFGANNMRLSESLGDIAEIINAIPGDFQPSSNDEQQALQIVSQSAISSNLFPGSVETPDGDEFNSIDEIVAPVTIMGDVFTAYQNLESPTESLERTGRGNRSNAGQAAVFDPANVVILTDGTCGSTCTIFSYMMLFQLNIKTIAVGGRPQTGVMQAIGGVEGAQVFSMAELASLAGAALLLAPAAGRQEPELQTGELGVLAQGYAVLRSLDPSSGGSVNGKNAFSPADSQTPLQFTMEPANCRFFYTAAMLSDPELVWQRAVDGTWTDPETFCVDGSIVSNDATEVKTVDPLFRQTSSGSGDDEKESAGAAGWGGAGRVGWSLVGVAALMAFM